MTSRGYWRAVLFVIAAMMVYWSVNKDEEPEIIQASEPKPVVVAAKKESEVEPTPKPVNTENLKPTTPESPDPNSQGLVQALEKMHVCLGTPKGELPTETVLPSLVNYLQDRSGETVFNSEEWRSTFLVLPNGEKRHIRIEYDMGENDEYVKKLKYYTVGPEGNLIPLAISPEHADNPSDSFVESLEKEGEVTMNEKASRMYFKDGTELYSVEHNGQIKEFELNKEGKLFRCLHMGAENETCECL